MKTKKKKFMSNNTKLKTTILSNHFLVVLAEILKNFLLTNQGKTLTQYLQHKHQRIDRRTIIFI